jgi:hypothetical protein
MQATLKARDAEMRHLSDQLAVKKAELAAVRAAGARDPSVGGWTSGEGGRPTSPPQPAPAAALPPAAPPPKPVGGPNEISPSPFAAMQGFPSSSDSDSEEDDNIDSRAPSPTSNGAAPSTPRSLSLVSGRSAALMHGGSGRMSSMSREMSMEVRTGHARSLEEMEGLLLRRTGEVQAAHRQVATLTAELDKMRQDVEVRVQVASWG